MRTVTVALAGNPNVGKSCLFNALTGTYQHVANYPGTTVEIKQGAKRYDDLELQVSDLPGTYSLTACSDEERVARDFLLTHRPDLVVDVIDATAPERHLYLATQIMEMGLPLILAFNMSDLAERRGIQLDYEHLSTLFGVPVIPTIAHVGKGVDQLLATIRQLTANPGLCRPYQVNYGKEIEAQIRAIMDAISSSQPELCRAYPLRWLAIKLIEQDPDALDLVKAGPIRDGVSEAVVRLSTIFGDEPHIVIAEKRYGFISGACQESIRRTTEVRHDSSDLLDSIALHPVLGIPIFLCLMYGVFWFTFRMGQYPMELLEWSFAKLAGLAWRILPAGPDNLIRSLMADGIIKGVGGVLVFLPNILILFLAIAILEDSGYMARAAFVTDRLMHKIGLHGKSFIPMLVGFGCTVPAIMATRILENRRDRLTTILVLPLFSCGARLTIYGLVIPAFFPPAWRGPVLWLVYFIGIVLALIGIRLLRLTMLKGTSPPFVMELPPYRVPTVRSISLHMWQRGWQYLKKAGTVILAISVILWLLGNFPRMPSEDRTSLSPQQIRQMQVEGSYLGRLGKAIEPVVRPLGFDWRLATALIGAIVAKEVFVSQLAISYALEPGSDQLALQDRLRQDYSPLTGLCVLLFCLIATPCAATVAATRAETG
ncbi:MAG: ferrous iron transport protein B, partial [Sedimentisphaerales bacterium]|nr:ferrous iron transport protein B [Sedimentisphaerales bacterium]